MDERKKKTVGLLRTLVSKRTVLSRPIQLERNAGMSCFAMDAYRRDKCVYQAFLRARTNTERGSVE